MSGQLVMVALGVAVVGGWVLVIGDFGAVALGGLVVPPAQPAAPKVTTKPSAVRAEIRAMARMAITRSDEGR